MIDIERILLELESLPPKDTWNEHQIMLQSVEGSNDASYGVGSISKYTDAQEDFNIPLFPNLTYTNNIIQDLNMYRTRVMLMPHKTCYSYHIDESPRIHIPLITNENCFFVIEDEVIRLPADGNHYLIDTTKKHTFVNASFEERIHIVGCISNNVS